jgi:hypothetical protein
LLREATRAVVAAVDAACDGAPVGVDHFQHGCRPGGGGRAAGA